ncbi:cyclin [Lentinula raphanica]|nr:cyclin [Lentinula raphanica]
MKDLSSTSNYNRHARNSLIYHKKRPSPHGVSKHHRSPLLSQNVMRKTPRSVKASLLLQRQQLRRDGVILEDEYRAEIRRYMHEMENYTMSSIQSMDQQPEIRWHMRPCLLDFLVEIHFSFRLRPETLYLTLNIVDRYVSRRMVSIKHYQLVGCAALWIAAKFEDAKERVPTVQDVVRMCHDAYEESAFIQMEGPVLSTIQWTLGHPTAGAWLRLICMEEPKVQHVARFLMEITLFYREFIKYAPSSIALAALTLARFLCGKPTRVWEETDECLEIVDLLDMRLAKHVNDLSEPLVKKYSYAFYSKAATFVVLPSSTPMSCSTSISDGSDDFPLTPIPITPALHPPPSDYDDKENRPTAFEPVYNKHRIDS